MKKWDNEAQTFFQNMPSTKTDIDTEKIYTASIKSKVNMEKEMTLKVEISETVKRRSSFYGSN